MLSLQRDYRGGLAVGDCLDRLMGKRLLQATPRLVRPEHGGNHDAMNRWPIDDRCTSTFQ
jgi:hypothetical protein